MKCIFVFVFFIIVIPAFSQIKIVNLTSKDPNDSFLYVGVRNCLRITDTINKNRKVNVLFASDMRIESNKNDYCIYPFLKTPETVIIKEGNSVYLNKVFRKKETPDPVAIIGMFQSKILSTSQIKATPYLSVILPDCNYKSGLKVSSYRVMTFRKSNLISDFGYFNGNKLSCDFLSALNNLKHNDEIIFSGIKIVGPDSRSRTIEDLIITIK